METVAIGDLVSVAGGHPGLVFDTPSRTKAVVAVIDPARGPVFRIFHPQALTERQEEGPHDQALRSLVRRTPPPVHGSGRGGTNAQGGRAGFSRGAAHRPTGR
jgi:hypothetical protein